MTQPAAASPRRDELLERTYRYVLAHGLADLSLRPLAAAVGSSPRVLLFLFGSKDGLVRAVLERARADELALLADIEDGRAGGLAEMVQRTWRWLAAPEHRGLLTLWAETYARSLVQREDAVAGFARRTVEDWLGVLATAQAPRRRGSRAGAAERTLALAVLRGALLDLLATGDADRAGAAVAGFVRLLRAS